MKDYVEYLLEWLDEERHYRGADGFVVGVSGGIDSAVVAYLLAELDPKNALGLILPCKSSEEDVEDATEVLKGCLLPYSIIDLSESHSTLFKAIGPEYSIGKDFNQTRVIDGNARARLRMTTLYTVAQARNAIVVGTDNAVEWYTGYFTKFGDGGVDVAPLIHLMKDEVYEMADYLHVPQKIIDKPPSAGLWEAQTDEDEIGTTYEILHKHLRGEEVPKKDLQVIQYWHERSHHKRALPRMPKMYHSL